MALRAERYKDWAKQRMGIPGESQLIFAGAPDLQLESEFRIQAFRAVDEEKSKAEGEGSCWTITQLSYQRAW